MDKERERMGILGTDQNRLNEFHNITFSNCEGKSAHFVNYIHLCQRAKVILLKDLRKPEYSDTENQKAIKKKIRRFNQNIRGINGKLARIQNKKMNVSRI